MKQALLLVLLLCGAGISKGQKTLIYSSGFGTGTSWPTGWSNDGQSGSWTISTLYPSPWPLYSQGSNLSCGSSTIDRYVTVSGVISTVNCIDIEVFWGGRRSYANEVNFIWSIDGYGWYPEGYTDIANVSDWVWVNQGSNISLSYQAEGVSNLRFRWHYDSDGAGGAYRIDDFKVYGTPAYSARILSADIGSTSWCAGETRTVTVTIKNTGYMTWTNSSPDVNIGVKWNADADYNIRTNANGLAPNATQTYSLTVTAPTTTGSNNLTFDVVKEGDCWFAWNSGTCGPGNKVFTSPALTINANPTPAPNASGATICSGNTATLTASGAGTGEGYKWYNQSTGGTLLYTGNPYITPVLTTSKTYYVRKYNTTSLCESASKSVAVTVRALPVITYTKTDVTCFNANNGTITITATGGSGSGYQYRIYNGSSWTAWQTNNVFSNLIPAAYLIEAKDGNGCVQDDCP